MNRVEMYKILEHEGGMTLIDLIAMVRRRINTIPTSIPKKVLIVKLFGFGNIILMSPLIKTLKENGIEVHVLTTGDNEGIVNAYKNIIDKGYFIKYEHITQIPVNSLLMLKPLRRENYDVVIDAEQVIEFSAILSHLINPKCLIGYYMEHLPKYKLYNISIPNNDDKHIVYQYLDFLKPFGLKCESPKLVPIPYDDEDEEYVNKRLSKFKSDDILIGICPFVGFQNRLRGWNKFDKLISELLKLDERIKIFVIGGNSEKNEIFKYIIDDRRVFPIVGWDFKKLFCLFNKLNIGISCDTGPMHLMACSNCFVISLFGPTDPEIYGPFTDKKYIIYKNLECSPCATNLKGKILDCDNNICMDKITVEDVLDAVNKVLVK